MLCESSNLYKQKLVKPKPLASKMAAVKKLGQKNREAGLQVECLFCAKSHNLKTNAIFKSEIFTSAMYNNVDVNRLKLKSATKLCPSTW